MKKKAQIEEQLDDVNIDVQGGQAIIIQGELQLTVLATDNELCIVDDIEREQHRTNTSVNLVHDLDF